MARATSEGPVTPPRKRKRSASREPSLGPPPVVTFSSPGRTFRRVLKGTSLGSSSMSTSAPETLRIHAYE